MEPEVIFSLSDSKAKGIDQKLQYLSRKVSSLNWYLLDLEVEEKIEKMVFG